MKDSTTAEERLEAALAEIRATLDGATPSQRALLLKRAGDVCVGLGEPRKALGWYGRAVDQHLQMKAAEQAAVLCRLIIHVQPEAVRARCTLTWIALAQDRPKDAAEQLAAYVEAAKRAGQTEVAAQQLGWLFEAARSEQVRERIVVGMLALGQDAIAGELASEMASGAAPSPLPHSQLWERVLRATVGPQAAAVVK